MADHVKNSRNLKKKKERKVLTQSEAQGTERRKKKSPSNGSRKRGKVSFSRKLQQLESRDRNKENRGEERL